MFDSNLIAHYAPNFLFCDLDSLYYTVVQVGTPNVTLLVALDMGSDLFWVPCDCQQCAPTSAPSYGLVCIAFSASPC
jgi:hypothetical protein